MTGTDISAFSLSTEVFYRDILNFYNKADDIPQKSEHCEGLQEQKSDIEDKMEASVTLSFELYLKSILDTTSILAFPTVVVMLLIAVKCRNSILQLIRRGQFPIFNAEKWDKKPVPVENEENHFYQVLLKLNIVY